ncbi:MAG TPA: L,D-transpeptidase [Gemmatimonadaceae bacterium]|nr:L,D-transpeptidase [Gemmatimonadaceae bacterium]
MHISLRIRLLATAPLFLFHGSAAGQTSLPANTAPANRESPAAAPIAAREAPLALRASVSERMLYVRKGDSTIKTFQVAVGTPRYPTPRGTFKVRKMIWNPSWRPPPGSDWARGKKATAPGDPRNPMKVVKIFFKEPDYYIHGTGEVESLGSAASHGCIRMDPEEIAELAKLIMEHGGQPREENWFLRLLHSRRQEKPIYLDSPIAITITE